VFLPLVISFLNAPLHAARLYGVLEKKERNERNIMASPLQLATSFLRRAVEVKACAADHIL
jgi:hypothetical protein